MSIDNIPLPPFLYPGFFGRNLVDLNENAKTDSAKGEAAISFLGGNEKKIIFLFHDPQNKFLPEVQVKFLFDLLTACQLTMGDIALVNLFHHTHITYRELITQLQANRILMFGIAPEDLDLPFTIPFFQVQNFQGQVYMPGPSIAELQMSVDLRKQLWVCLKKLFNIQK